MSDILYVIRHVPNSDAMTLRCASLIRLMKSAGYSVDLMSTCMVPVESDLNDLTIGADRYLSPDALSIGSKVYRHVEVATGFVASREVMHYIDREKPTAVLFYGGTSTLVSRVARHAITRGVAVLVDETDWFEPGLGMSVYSWIYYALDNRRIRRIDPGLSGQITISPYFTSYFAANGGNPFFLPPCIADFPDPVAERYNGVSIVYAGSPLSSKDILLPFAEALLRFDAECRDSARENRISLRVVGSSADEVCSPLGIDKDELEAASITCFGRISHEDSLRIVGTSAFGLLLRHPELYAKAGFSTKFVEYLSCGTAPICNDVGGADRIVEHGVDGLVLGAEETGADALLKLLRQLNAMSSDEISAFGVAARRKAGELFVESRYEGPFSEYMSSVLNGRSKLATDE